jgi:hypothetical protein
MKEDVPSDPLSRTAENTVGSTARVGVIAALPAVGDRGRSAEGKD